MEAAEAEGFEIIDLSVAGRNRIVATIAHDPAPVSVDDCIRVTRAIRSRLRDLGFDPRDFHVEIASPGIHRRLRTRRHWETFVGHDVAVELLEDRDGRRRFEGRLEAVDDAGVRIAAGPDRHDFPFAAIREGRLRG